MIRRRYVLSMQDIEQLLTSHRATMEMRGIDMKDLVAYSVQVVAQSSYVSASDDDRFETVKQYLAKDLIEEYGELSSKHLHQCMDFVIDAADVLKPFFNRTLGGVDHSLHVETFLGSDLVVSLQIPEEDAYRCPRETSNYYPSVPRQFTTL